MEMLNKHIRETLSKTLSKPNATVWVSFLQLLQENKLLSSLQQNEVFNKILECEVLQAQGGGWKKGKIRFRYVAEIILDEELEQYKTVPEQVSPLDDIRNSI